LMSGFPRPVYAGDYQAVKFYDLPLADSIFVLPVSGAAVPIARLSVRDVVAKHLYAIEFGPFYLGRTGIAAPDEQIQLLLTFKAPSDETPDIARRFNVEVERRRETYSIITGHFLAPETGTYTAAVVARRLNPVVGSNAGISIDNSIFGVRGVASPETDLIIQNTPEV
jgi:hypothetical protein